MRCPHHYSCREDRQVHFDFLWPLSLVVLRTFTICISPNHLWILAVHMDMGFNCRRLLCATQVTKVRADELLMLMSCQCCWHRRTKFLHGDDRDSAIHATFANAQNALNVAVLGELLAARLAVTS